MTELAPYSARPETSRGRRVAEPAPEGRSEYQRDRDRIVHSTAFRRLEYKTQVFVNHEGDLFRTRLTHSIEVAQIARSIARNLRLNEDLVESIALAHDLGHTPFGHSGQDALNECMRDFGGFEHNLQSLRVVDVLEQRYGAFDGLNLCFETREGIIKHCSQANAQTLGELGERFVLKRQPSLEAQLTNFADEIAYNNHDIDDGLRSGLITLGQISETGAFTRHANDVKREFPDLQDRRLIHETIRRMISTLVTDLTEESRRRILEYRPADLEAVRTGPALISFSAAIKSEQRELQGFLRKNLYKHYRVQRMSNKARRIVRELFFAFRDDPQLLPPEFQARARDDAPRAIADYVAGMTDRYAIKEFRRIFTVDSF